MKSFPGNVIHPPDEMRNKISNILIRVSCCSLLHFSAAVGWLVVNGKLLGNAETFCGIYFGAIIVRPPRVILRSKQPDETGLKRITFLRVEGGDEMKLKKEKIIRQDENAQLII